MASKTLVIMEWMLAVPVCGNKGDYANRFTTQAKVGDPVQRIVLLIELAQVANTATTTRMQLR